MQVFKNIKGKEVKVFAITFEGEAFDQVKKMANFEAYQDSKIRIMPDAHAGKGCTVGTTMTITDKITPSMVGADIGCGMLTVSLLDSYIDFEKLDNVIKNFVPSGFDVHKSVKAKFDFSKLVCSKRVDTIRAAYSLGTLGGGNHFIEVAKSEKTGKYYLIIHTGSRKLGGDVCKFYQDKAISSFSTASEQHFLIEKLKKEGRTKDINTEIEKLKKAKPQIEKDLAYLEGQKFKNYMNDMSIVQKFASVNRETIANIIIDKMGFDVESKFETIHNYIDFKRMILRKGSVSAENGETLLIPINMRDGSLLCVGKGNVDWNYSAPHGAGRLMSRGKAKENIDLETFEESMKGIYTTSVGMETIDEAPQAYKSIEEIKTAIVDTVDIIDILKPVYNFKAH